MSHHDNFYMYRATLANETPPCIPYLGLFLRDLTFVEEGHASTAADGKLNFSKFRKMAQVVLAFKEYQQLAYNLVPIPAIQLMILNGNKLTPQGLYQRSLNLEPREDDVSCSPSTPHVSSFWARHAEKHRVKKAINLRKPGSFSPP